MLAMRTIGVRLNAVELEALRAVASREDRDPRRQAARLLREALERDGALPADDPKPVAAGSPAATTVR
jgi:hypothetical protein